MNVGNSILVDVKKLVGIAATDSSFDTDIIIHVNDAFQRLHQLGVGPSSIFTISSSQETWADFFSSTTQMPMVLSYIALYVRRAFDPPTGGTLDSLDRQIQEKEWLLNATVDPTEDEIEKMNLEPLW